MMNGRQRCGHGIVSHESGRTTRKKIANVAVGKSTARKPMGGGEGGCGDEVDAFRDVPRRGEVRAAGFRCRGILLANGLWPLLDRRLDRRRRDGGRRVTAVTESPDSASSSVCSTGGANHAGSARGRRGAGRARRPAPPGGGRRATRPTRSGRRAPRRRPSRPRSRPRRAPRSRRRPRRRRGRGPRAGAAAPAAAAGRGLERAEPGVRRRR